MWIWSSSLSHKTGGRAQKGQKSQVHILLNENYACRRARKIYNRNKMNKAFKELYKHFTTSIIKD